MTFSSSLSLWPIISPRPTSKGVRFWSSVFRCPDGSLFRWETQSSDWEDDGGGGGGGEAAGGELHHLWWWQWQWWWLVVVVTMMASTIYIDRHLPHDDFFSRSQVQGKAGLAHVILRKTKSNRQMSPQSSSSSSSSYHHHHIIIITIILVIKIIYQDYV